jgi:hypothetical protein
VAGASDSTGCFSQLSDYVVLSKTPNGYRRKAENLARYSQVVSKTVLQQNKYTGYLNGAEIVFVAGVAVYPGSGSLASKSNVRVSSAAYSGTAFGAILNDIFAVAAVRHEHLDTREAKC